MPAGPTSPASRGAAHRKKSSSVVAGNDACVLFDHGGESECRSAAVCTNVKTVQARDARCNTLASFVVEDGKPGPQRA